MEKTYLQQLDDLGQQELLSQPNSLVKQQREPKDDKQRTKLDNICDDVP